MKKSYIKCKECGKYSLKSKFKLGIEEKLVKGVCVYRDCGYGDDDQYADVTYSVLYGICPYCGGKNERDRITIKEENRCRPKW